VLRLYPIINISTKPDEVKAGKFSFKGTITPGPAKKDKLLHAFLFDTGDLTNPAVEVVKVKGKTAWEVTFDLKAGKTYALLICAGECGGQLAKEAVQEFDKVP
jgi:hypothetical protein